MLDLDGDRHAHRPDHLLDDVGGGDRVGERDRQIHVDVAEIELQVADRGVADVDEDVDIAHQAREPRDRDRAHGQGARTGPDRGGR